MKDRTEQPLIDFCLGWEAPRVDGERPPFMPQGRIAQRSIVRAITEESLFGVAPGGDAAA